MIKFKLFLLQKQQNVPTYEKSINVPTFLKVSWDRSGKSMIFDSFPILSMMRVATI